MTQVTRWLPFWPVSYTHLDVYKRQSKKRKVSGVLLSMGIPAGVAEGALRFSLAADNDCAQIDYACEKAGALYQALKGFRRK